jgi:hypothetical protein
MSKAFPALLIALVTAGGLSACGDAPPSGRYAVVTRDLDWSVDTASAPAHVPLSRTWDFSTEQGDWTVAAGEGTMQDGFLALHGAGRVELTGPGVAALDIEVLHWLTLRVATGSARRVRLRWRGGAPVTRELDPAGGEQDLTLAIESLQSVNHDASAPDLSLAFENDDNRPLVVHVLQIGLASDFDPDGGLGYVAGRH